MSSDINSSFFNPYSSIFSSFGTTEVESNSSQDFSQHPELVHWVKDIAYRFGLQARLNILEVDTSCQPPLCKLQLDLSYLFQNLQNIEQNNDKVRNLIISLSDVLIHNDATQNRPHYAFEIYSLDLSHNAISSRSILSIDMETGRSFFLDGFMHRVKQLNLSHTLTSSKGLNLLYLLPNLEEVNLNHCPNITHVLGNHGSCSHHNAMNLTCQKMRRISLIDTALYLPRDWLKILEKKFPEIEQINLSQPADGKFLGLKDIVRDQTIINPLVAMKCGHIFSEAFVLSGHANSCIKCHQDPGEWREANFNITNFRKKEGRWVATVLDFAYRPLEGRVYFHPNCKHAFTEETLKKLFSFLDVQEQQEQEWVKQLEEFECPGCLQNQQETSLKLIRVYPDLTPDEPAMEESVQQQTLSQICEYAHI